MVDINDFTIYCQVKLGLDRNSIRLCTIRLNRFMNWLRESGKSLQALTVEEFLVFLKDQGLKNNSINSYVFMFRQLDRYLTGRNLPLAGITAGLKTLPKNTPLVDILTIEEIEKLLDTHLSYGSYQGLDSQRLDKIFLTMTRLFATTGCRFSECNGLKVKDLNLPAGRIRFNITKTDEPRFAYICEPLISQLKDLIQDRCQDELVFIGMKGREIHPQSYIDDLKLRAKKAGITKRIYPHLFRHSYISHMISNGTPVEIVARLVGHDDIQTTYKTYFHTGSDFLQKQSYRHALVRTSVPIKEIFEMFKCAVKSVGVELDPRFVYSFTETESKILVEVGIR